MSRAWNDQELAIVQEHYPNGSHAAQEALHQAGYTDRTITAISRQAQRANLHATQRLTPNQQTVLNTLRTYHPCPLTHADLNEETQLSPDTVITALRKFMKHGLVDRRPDPYPNTQYPAFLYFLVEAPSE